MKNKYITLAKKMSFLSNHPKARVGAVLVNGARILGLGFNSMKTHTKSPSPWCHLHAEVASIFNARTDICGADIYVYREDRNGNMALSKPCKFCHNFLLDKKVRRVYYSTSEGMRMMKL